MERKIPYTQGIKLSWPLILLGLLIGTYITLAPGAILMFVVILIAGWAVFFISGKEDRDFLLKLFVSGILVRILLLSLFYSYSSLTGGYNEITPDSRLFSLFALGKYKLFQGDHIWLARSAETIEALRLCRAAVLNGFLYVLVLFYKITGYDPSSTLPPGLFSDKLINVLLSVITGVMIFCISKEIFGRKVAKLSSILVTFWPSLILWSITNLKESSCIFLTAFIVLHTVRFQKKYSLANIICIAIALPGLFTLRKSLFWILILLFLFFFLIHTYFRMKSIGRVVMLISCILIVSFLLINTNFGITLKNKISVSNFIASAIAKNKAILSQQGSSYYIYDKITKGGQMNILNFTISLMKGWFYFLLVPFPWIMSTRLQLLTYPQMIIWYILLPFALLGLLFSLRFKFINSAFIISYLFIFTSLAASVEGNIGTALRHRDLILPFYLIFSAAGIMRMTSGGTGLAKST